MLVAQPSFRGRHLASVEETGSDDVLHIAISEIAAFSQSYTSMQTSQQPNAPG